MHSIHCCIAYLVLSVTEMYSCLPILRYPLTHSDSYNVILLNSHLPVIVMKWKRAADDAVFRLLYYRLVCYWHLFYPTSTSTGLLPHYIILLQALTQLFQRFSTNRRFRSHPKGNLTKVVRAGLSTISRMVSVPVRAAILFDLLPVLQFWMIRPSSNRALTTLGLESGLGFSLRCR